MSGTNLRTLSRVESRPCVCVCDCSQSATGGWIRCEFCRLRHRPEIPRRQWEEFLGMLYGEEL
jgi:hypothetical protein